ncbi:MAG: hypothetical protein WBA93_36870 [Microcoleaceae cyanobacterium]
MFYNSGKAPDCILNNTPFENEIVDEVVCYGKNCILSANAVYSDARRREVGIYFVVA